MKAHFLAIFILAACHCSYAGDPMTQGGMSENLAVSMTFEQKSSPANGCFAITLANISTNDLVLMVDPTNFHGSIVIVSPDGRSTEYFEERFRWMLLTSVWTDPVQNLKRGGVISWKVPTQSLRDVHGNHLPALELEGATAYAELNEVAIIPPHYRYLASNAAQRSTKIKIDTKAR